MDNTVIKKIPDKIISPLAARLVSDGILISPLKYVTKEQALEMYPPLNRKERR